MEIIRDTEACYGCRTCELVCSFHHEKVFNPELSNIKVSKNNRTAVITWSIDSNCDSCEGEDQPLCIKFCPYWALKAVEVEK